MEKQGKGCTGNDIYMQGQECVEKLSGEKRKRGSRYHDYII